MRRMWRRPVAAGADTPTMGERVGHGARQGLWTLARVVDLVVTAVVLLIVAGILLIVFKASPTNDIVNWVTDAARWLTGPFDGMFNLDNPRGEIALNWGIAAAVYFIAGRLVSRFLRR
jgi:hypothetical protein